MLSRSRAGAVKCCPYYKGERMNMMANGNETAIPIILKTIPIQTGTSRILFSATVVIIIAHISIIRWLMPKVYWFMLPVINHRPSHKTNIVPTANDENPEIFKIWSKSLSFELSLRIR